MQSDDTSKPMSRAMLQLHINAAINQRLSRLDLPYDAQHRARLVRCLMRRTVCELLPDLKTADPKVIMHALLAVMQDVVVNMAADGELQLTASTIESSSQG